MNNPIYLDYMATTPIDPEVYQAMQPYMTLDGCFGNPSSIHHKQGWQAHQAIKTATSQLCKLISAPLDSITFTSGATESINLALQGSAHYYQKAGNHIITFATEHQATLQVCQRLKQQGFEITILPVLDNGLIDLNLLKKTIKPTTTVISVLHVNNEIGVIQPIQDLAKICKQSGVLLHVDAAQTLDKLPLSVADTPIDLMSLSSHKMYGPKGIGALYVRQQPKRQLTPIFGDLFAHGPLRPGTLPTHQIVGMGAAAAYIQQNLDQETQRVQRLHQLFVKHLSAIPNIQFNGCLKHRVPHNINITFNEIHGETLIMRLTDIAASQGSACNKVGQVPSHVLTALGLNRRQANATLRLSIGRYTTEQNIIQAASHLKDIVVSLR
jgi:cysteine desulfurase